MGGEPHALESFNEPIKKKSVIWWGKPNPAFLNIWPGLEANLIAFWGWQWVTRGGMAVSLGEGRKLLSGLVWWRKCL